MSIAQLHGKKQDNTGWKEIDQSDGNIASIDVAHKQVHWGLHFTSCDNATINASAVRSVAIVTPNTDVEAHMTLTVNCNNAGTWIFYKDSKLSNNGTAVTVFNNKFASTTTSGVLIFHTPTISTSGTVFRTLSIGSSGANFRIGGEAYNRTEIILKKNTKYLSRFTAVNNSTIINHVPEWYDYEE